MSKIAELHRIFNTKGRRSKELYLHLEKYVYYLMNRYYPDWNKNADDRDDKLQGAFLKVYHALEYFDPAKGNMATFLHRAVRNYIQVTQHYSNLDTTMKDGSDFDLSSVSDYKGETDEKHELLMKNSILNSMELKYSTRFIRDLCDKNISSKPVERLIAWRKLNCHN